MSFLFILVRFTGGLRRIRQTIPQQIKTENSSAKPRAAMPTPDELVSVELLFIPVPVEFMFCWEIVRDFIEDGNDKANRYGKQDAASDQEKFHLMFL